MQVALIFIFLQFRCIIFSPSDNLIQNLSKPTIASYSVKERRSHTTMVAKFLGLNKPWSCQYGGEKTTTKNFLCIIALRNERVAGIFLPSFDNTWPSVSVKEDYFLRSRNFASLVTWHHTSPLYRSNIL